MSVYVQKKDNKKEINNDNFEPVQILAQISTQDNMYLLSTACEEHKNLGVFWG